MVNFLSNCILCDAGNVSVAMMCSTCFAELELLPQENLLHYPQVANNITHQYVDQLFCVADYKPPISDWLIVLKYHQQIKFTMLLAQVLLPLFKRVLARYNQELVVTTVPIHVSRWLGRGFNQCHLILNPVVSSLPVMYKPDLLFKTEDDTQQAGLKGQERRNRIRNFEIHADQNIQGKTIILFDDVITTGSTANALAKLLKAAGAVHVCVITMTISLTKK